MLGCWRLSAAERSGGGLFRGWVVLLSPPGIARSVAAAKRFLALLLQLAGLPDEFLLSLLQLLLDLGVEPIQLGSSPQDGRLGLLQGEITEVHLPAPAIPGGLLLAPRPAASFQRFLEVREALASLLCRRLHPVCLGGGRLESFLLGERLLTQPFQVLLRHLLLEHPLEQPDLGPLTDQRRLGDLDSPDALLELLAVGLECLPLPTKGSLLGESLLFRFLGGLQHPQCLGLLGFQLLLLISGLPAVLLNVQAESRDPLLLHRQLLLALGQVLLARLQGGGLCGQHLHLAVQLLLAQQARLVQLVLPAKDFLTLTLQQGLLLANGLELPPRELRQARPLLAQPLLLNLRALARVSNAARLRWRVVGWRLRLNWGRGPGRRGTHSLDARKERIQEVISR